MLLPSNPTTMPSSLSAAANLVCVLLLCSVVLASALRAEPCPEKCRSFVSLGNTVGQAVVGPGVDLSWAIDQATASTVQEVTVRIKVLSKEISNFVLNRCVSLQRDSFFFSLCSCD